MTPSQGGGWKEARYQMLTAKSRQASTSGPGHLDQLQSDSTSSLVPLQEIQACDEWGVKCELPIWGDPTPSEH